MNGLSKVWRRNLQRVLEALSLGVIITLETGHIVFAKHAFLEIASGIVGGWSRSSETPRCCLWIG